MSVVGVLIITIIPMLICMVLAAMFVYSDAKKRNMNEVVWALVAFFVPVFIGVIVYIAIREPITTNACPVCGEAISGNDRECKKCHTILMTACNKCGFPLKKDWKVCPGCGNELPEKFNQPVTVYKKESGIIPIVIIIGILVLAFVLVSAFCFGVVKESSSSSSYSGYRGMYNIKAEDFSGNDAITKWIKDSDKDNAEVAVLLSKTSGVCIVYVKDNDYLLEDSIDLDYINEGSDMETFKATLNIDKSQYKDKYGYDFLVYELEVLDDIQLTVNVDGQKQDVEVTYIDSDISIDSWEVK